MNVDASSAMQQVLASVAAPPPVDAAELTKTLLTAASQATDVATDLASVSAATTAGGGAPDPEAIAAVQAALGLVASVGTSSGASAAS